MAQPTEKDIRSWFAFAFDREPRKDYYIHEWIDRFETPKRVWASSDYQRRGALAIYFPVVFGGLGKDDDCKKLRW